MKMIILLLAFFASLAASARAIPPRLDTGRYGYVEVVTADGIPAPELYARAKAWVAQQYRSAQHVIQLDDPSTGKLVVKGNFPGTARGDAGVYYVGHTLTLEVKPGRYRYTLTDFDAKIESATVQIEQVSDPTVTPQLLRIAVTESAMLVESIKAAMLSPSPATDTNW